MSPTRPKVFIGSSTEALKIARAVKHCLEPVAEVILWDETDRYQKPTKFLLDSLLAAPALFDFAVLVFGPDDRVASRGKTAPVPRDNVVFELGLFLAHLGLDRTFVLVPQAKRDKLHILSDLHNLRLFEFTRGNAMDESVAKPCATMAERIRELGSRDADLGPKHVSDVGASIMQLIGHARRLGQPLSVCNIALDMEMTWPMLRDRVLAVDSIEGITWLSLMVDPISPQLAGYWSDTVSHTVAAHAEASIRQFCAEHAAALDRRRIRFECRAYPTPPIVHGFLFGKDRAFVSMCSIRDGKLVGGPNPYVPLQQGTGQPRSDVTAHLISAFEAWFHHQWTTGSRPVWPLPTSP